MATVNDTWQYRNEGWLGERLHLKLKSVFFFTCRNVLSKCQSTSQLFVNLRETSHPTANPCFYCVSGGTRLCLVLSILSYPCVTSLHQNKTRLYHGKGNKSANFEEKEEKTTIMSCCRVRVWYKRLSQQDASQITLFSPQDHPWKSSMNNAGIRFSFTFHVFTQTEMNLRPLSCGRIEGAIVYSSLTAYRYLITFYLYNSLNF